MGIRQTHEQGQGITFTFCRASHLISLTKKLGQKLAPLVPKSFIEHCPNSLHMSKKCVTTFNAMISKHAYTCCQQLHHIYENSPGSLDKIVLQQNPNTQPHGNIFFCDSVRSITSFCTINKYLSIPDWPTNFHGCLRCVN